MRSDAIVVGYDGAPRSESALEWAIGEALQGGGHIVVVVAWHHPPLVPGSEARSEAERAACEVGDQARERLADAGVGHEVRLVEGDAATALLGASQLARVLVLGEPHRGLGRLGSVARKCQADAACPVQLIAGDA